MIRPRDHRASIAPDAATETVQYLVALGDEGMASGIDEGFDIDAFVDETAAPPSALPSAPPAG